MAVSAHAVIQVRGGGNDLNGGGFVLGSAGIDYSQQDSPQAVLVSNNEVDNSTNRLEVNPAEYIVNSSDRGNLFYAPPGVDGNSGHFQIVDVDTGANEWVVDRPLGSNGDLMWGRMGGAKATPGGASAAVPQYGAIYLQPGAEFELTSSTANVSGGRIDRVNSGGGPIGIFSDPANPATIGAGSLTSTTLVRLVGNMCGIVLDGNNQSGITGVEIRELPSLVDCCEIANCAQAVACGSGIVYRVVYATRIRNCALLCNSSGVIFIRCQADSPTTAGGLFADCQLDSLAGNLAIDGPPADALFVLGCTIAGAGIRAANEVRVVESLITGNAAGKGVEIQFSGRETAGHVRGLYSRGHASADLANAALFASAEVVALAADPYEGSGSGDFRLNGTAGGGLELRGARRPIPTQTDARDIGAPQVAAGGGAMNLLRRLQAISGARILNG